MSELEELINQGGEAFVLLFLVVGAIGVAVALFIASPKKFIKSLLKDFWKSLEDKYDKEEKPSEEVKNEPPEFEAPKLEEPNKQEEK